MAGVVFRKLGWVAGATLALGLGLGLSGMPAHAQYSDGFNFLKAVKDRDGTEATKFLSETGSVVVNTRDRATGETALHITVRRRDELWTKFMLDRGANPNSTDKSGVTPLALAASMGFIEGVELLLERGARADVTNTAGETPLIAAVHRRDAGMIRLLLKNGASADRSDNSGRTARDYAKLMGLAAEIDRAEAERKAAPAAGTYGPGA